MQGRLDFPSKGIDKVLGAMSTAYTLSVIKQPTESGSGPRPDRTDWSDDELLAEGYAVNLTTVRALQQRLYLSNLEAAALLCMRLRSDRRMVWVRAMLLSH